MKTLMSLLLCFVVSTEMDRLVLFQSKPNLEIKLNEPKLLLVDLNSELVEAIENVKNSNTASDIRLTIDVTTPSNISLSLYGGKEKISSEDKESPRTIGSIFSIKQKRQSFVFSLNPVLRRLNKNLDTKQGDKLPILLVVDPNATTQDVFTIHSVEISLPKGESK